MWDGAPRPWQYQQYREQHGRTVHIYASWRCIVVEKFNRSGGRKRVITRERQGQVIPAIYETGADERHEFNGDVNRKHARVPSGWYAR